MTERARTSPAPTEAPAAVTDSVVIGLNAVVIVVTGDMPKVLTVQRPYAPLLSGAAEKHHFVDVGDASAVFGLPFGPFDPALHRTLEIGLRSWVEEQTHLRVEYVEQLYTFGDRGRSFGVREAPRIISVGYLALTREEARHALSEGTWESWYRYFPWEDWRRGEPSVITGLIRPRLEAWVAAAQGAALRAHREARLNACFGLGGIPWDEEMVLERYELLYEAGLVAEALRDRLERGPAGRTSVHPSVTTPYHIPPEASGLEGAGGDKGDPGLGDAMQFDHRRVLATAMGRLRGKLKYRPVVFELMGATFTLLELQRTVEAISGVRVHKQNFRRMVDRSGLVEGTGQFLQTRGRPAEAFRFRKEALRERAATGLSLSRTRSEKT